jgi:CheY-like chemotaxis protein
MDIVCQNCHSKLKVADGKLPAGKTASLTCPKCKQKITVQAPQLDTDFDEADGFEDFFSFEETSTETYDASEKPFDFVEEEGKTALLCESEPSVKEKIKTVLKVLEYHVTEPQNSRDALRKMRYHNYDLIVVNEYFDAQQPDANAILIYLERLNMAIRRHIFVALVSSRFRTMDHMAAFQKSVNMVVNLSNIDDFDKILRRRLADNDLFFRILKERLIQ